MVTRDIVPSTGIQKNATGSTDMRTRSQKAGRSNQHSLAANAGASVRSQTARQPSRHDDDFDDGSPGIDADEPQRRAARTRAANGPGSGSAQPSVLNLGRRNNELAGDADELSDTNDDSGAPDMDDDFNAPGMDEDHDDPEESASNIANDDAMSLDDDSVSHDSYPHDAGGDVMTEDEAIEHFGMMGDKLCKFCCIACESWSNRVLHQRDHHGLVVKSRRCLEKDETYCAECNLDFYRPYELQQHYIVVHEFELPGRGTGGAPHGPKEPKKTAAVRRTEREQIRHAKIALGKHRGWRWQNFVLDSAQAKEAIRAMREQQVRTLYMNTNGAALIIISFSSPPLPRFSSSSCSLCEYIISLSHIACHILQPVTQPIKLTSP